MSVRPCLQAVRPSVPPSCASVRASKLCVYVAGFPCEVGMICAIPALTCSKWEFRPKLSADSGIALLKVGIPKPLSADSGIDLLLKVGIPKLSADSGIGPNPRLLDSEININRARSENGVQQLWEYQ